MLGTQLVLSEWVLTDLLRPPAKEMSSIHLPPVMWLYFLIIKHTSEASFFKNIYLFIWLCWVFIAACGLSLVAVSGGYSPLRCVGLSLRWLLLLRSTGSRCVGFSGCGSWALECRLSSCGARV